MLSSKGFVGGNKMKRKILVLGIIMCTWYAPFIALLSAVTGFINQSSIDALLAPLAMIILYGIGLFLVYDSTIETISIKSEKQEKKIIEKKRFTTCWKCKTEYYFIKNPSGDTMVECPKCGNKGLIK